MRFFHLFIFYTSLGLCDCCNTRPPVIKIKVIANNSFIAVPECEKLDRSNKKIGALEPLAFRGLVKLKRMHLEGNEITRIFPELWTDLVSLQYLHLDSNHLTSIDEGTFCGLHRLEVLMLKNNQIDSIGKNGFCELRALRYLDMSGNFLTVIRRHSLSNLKRLAVLDLEENRIQTVEPGALSYFFPTKTVEIYLMNNKLSNFSLTVVQIARGALRRDVPDICSLPETRGLNCHKHACAVRGKCWPRSLNCLRRSKFHLTLNKVEYKTEFRCKLNY